MSVKSENARTVIDRWICDECGEEMEPSGKVQMMSDPPLVPHACPNGHMATAKETYPKVRVVSDTK